MGEQWMKSRESRTMTTDTSTAPRTAALREETMKPLVFDDDEDAIAVASTQWPDSEADDDDDAGETEDETNDVDESDADEYVEERPTKRRKPAQRKPARAAKARKPNKGKGSKGSLVNSQMARPRARLNSGSTSAATGRGKAASRPQKELESQDSPDARVEAGEATGADPAVEDEVDQLASESDRELARQARRARKKGKGRGPGEGPGWPVPLLPLRAAADAPWLSASQRSIGLAHAVSAATNRNSSS